MRSRLQEGSAHVFALRPQRALRAATLIDTEITFPDVRGWLKLAAGRCSTFGAVDYRLV
jgi:hypothetical protein